MATKIVSERARVRSVTIVKRRSGPGYRVVLCLVTLGGTPVLDTIDDSFPTIEAARSFALDQLGAQPDQVRVKLGAG